MSGKRSAESRFKEFPYRVGNAKWKWKWQPEAFTDVGKLPVPGAGQAVPWGSGGWAGVWRLGRCVEAEKRTQFFAKGRGKAQVWRQEEAGL